MESSARGQMSLVHGAERGIDFIGWYRFRMIFYALNETIHSSCLLFLQLDYSVMAFKFALVGSTMAVVGYTTYKYMSKPDASTNRPRSRTVFSSSFHQVFSPTNPSSKKLST